MNKTKQKMKVYFTDLSFREKSCDIYIKLVIVFLITCHAL